jgi:hypothetical protein
MAFDIVSFCQDFQIPYGKTGIVSRGRIGLPCPSKGINDIELHAAFNPASNSIYSWVIGAIPLKDYLEFAAPGVPFHKLLKDYSTDFDYIERLQHKENAKVLEYNFKPLGKVARKYLANRGFNVDELEEKYKFREGGIIGDFAYRVIIPVMDEKGKVLTYQGRSYAGDKIRYKTLAIEKSLVDPKSVLFNLQNCKKDWVCVVEGPLDALKWGDDCCATLGTSTTEAQVQLLTKYKKVVILFDSEETAQARAKKLAANASALGVPEVLVVDLETEKDLGAMSYEAANSLKKELGL